jgi:mannose-6-phosphate isomerase-like protein (cupin superfamily)
MPSPVNHPQESREYFFEEGCFILELLNDPVDAEASVARARVPPATETRRHRLRGTTERYVILSGEGLVFIGDAPPEAVGPGDVALIPPLTCQHIRNTGNTDLVFLAICTPRFEPGNYLPE